ncbi:glycosyltransferase family 4 protein (plasmid) [Shimia sp. W99]
MHENVRETVRRLCIHGARVTVVCSGGPFAASLRETSAQVLETDYELINGLVKEALKWGPFDLVHVHPGPSREFGLRLARVAGIPVCLTLHGEWLDNIHMFWDRFARIFTVSQAVRDKTLKAAPAAAGFVEMMPNGVDLEKFTVYQRLAPPESGRRPRVIVASRFDADKQRLTDFLVELWQVQKPEAVFHWEVAGTGTQIGQLQQAADRLNRTYGTDLVRFHGWLEASALYELYTVCDFSISPGRSAMESMAMGLPTVALGSQGCFGLITPDRTDQAAWSNFGGAGLLEQTAPTSVLEEMLRLWQSSAKFLATARFVADYIHKNFDAAHWHDQLESTYLSVLNGEMRPLVSDAKSPQFPT